jgi:hypothetical protein
LFGLLNGSVLLAIQIWGCLCIIVTIGRYSYYRVLNFCSGTFDVCRKKPQNFGA